MLRKIKGDKAVLEKVTRKKLSIPRYRHQILTRIIPIFNKTLENKRFMRSVCCAGQSLCFAQDWYCTASSKARCAFACEPDGSQAIKRFFIVLLKNSMRPTSGARWGSAVSRCRRQEKGEPLNPRRSKRCMSKLDSMGLPTV